MTLRKAYSEMMDRIVVTGQMRERILNRVQSENLEGQLSEKTCWQKYRKYFAAAACLCLQQELSHGITQTAEISQHSHLAAQQEKAAMLAAVHPGKK